MSHKVGLQATLMGLGQPIYPLWLSCVLLYFIHPALSSF